MQTNISKCKVRLRDLYEHTTFKLWSGCTIPNPQTCYTNSVFSSYPSLRAPCGSVSVCLAAPHTRLQNWFAEKKLLGGAGGGRLTDLVIEFLSLMNMNVSADTRKEIIRAWEQDWMTFLAAKVVCEISAYSLESFSKERISSTGNKRKRSCATRSWQINQSVNALKKIRQQWLDAQTLICIQRMTQTLGMWLNNKPQLQLFDRTHKRHELRGLKDALFLILYPMVSKYHNPFKQLETT